MQNGTIVDQILAHVPEINFSVSYEDEAVSLFETTIRYLGGMLSAYDLLNGPFTGLASNVSTADKGGCECASALKKLHILIHINNRVRKSTIFSFNP